MGNMKIKAKIKGDTLKCKIQATHIMLPYDAAKKKGVDANFITHIVGKVGERIVYEASTSQFVSKNPIFKFQFKGIGAKGDKVEMNWVDRKGNTGKGKGKIK